MKDNLKKEYDEGADIWGHPQKYKGIELYPIKIKDLKYQKLFYHLLSHPKNYIINREILKSSYLKFILFVISSSNNQTPDDFKNEVEDFLGYITHQKVEIVARETGGQGLLSVELKFKVGDTIFTEYDFDCIREIILEQNSLSIDYVEEYNPEMEEFLAYTSRGMEDITLQDQLFTFCVMMRKALPEIEDYTLHQFNQSMERMLVLREYDLYKPLVVSGQITLKSGEIKNYFYHSKKSGRYDSIKIDKDVFDKSDIAKASLHQ